MEEPDTVVIYIIRSRAATQQVTFEALINIRPRQNNPALEILDPAIQKRVADIVHRLLGAV